MPVPKHPSFNSSRLVRSLAALGIADVADSTQTFAERLSGWIGWTDAPVLSAALAADSPAPAASLVPSERQAGAEEVQQVRRELARAIESDEAFAALPARSPAHGRPAGAGASTVPASTEPGFDPAFARRRHAVLQQLMEDRIRVLRERVRAALAAAAPTLSRVAALDAAFEQALSARERPLLSGAAGLVESHIERRRDARTPPGHEAPPATAADNRRAMRELLLAELDYRLQPIDGLMAALQQHPAGPEA